MKFTFILLFVISVAECNAAPIRLPSSAITRLFKPVFSANEASVAGRSAEDAASANLKSLKSPYFLEGSPKDLHPSYDVGQSFPRSRSLVFEPSRIPNAEPVAKRQKDLESYKALQPLAMKGDADAMLKMARMTASGKVTDPAEPYYGYWMIAAQKSTQKSISKSAHQMLDGECRKREDKRKIDQWFDAGCNSIDGRRLYAGSSEGTGIPIWTTPTTPETSWYLDPDKRSVRHWPLR